MLGDVAKPAIQSSGISSSTVLSLTDARKAGAKAGYIAQGGKYLGVCQAAREDKSEGEYPVALYLAVDYNPTGKSNMDEAGMCSGPHDEHRVLKELGGEFCRKTNYPNYGEGNVRLSADLWDPKNPYRTVHVHYSSVKDSSRALDAITLDGFIESMKQVGPRIFPLYQSKGL